MPAEKNDQAAELAAVRAENERLKGQLAEATSRTANVPAARPFLTEGERQDLLTFGVTSGTQGRRMTLTEAKARFPEVDFESASDVAKANDESAEALPKRAAIRGFDYVYPSVAPGKLAPEAVGQPGISGPVE